LVIPIAATYTLLQVQKNQVRKEVKRQIIDGIDTKELVLLIFTEEEANTRLHWEHSKEFEYNGLMYDMVKMEIIGDTAYYWCWCDHEETKLNKQFDDLVAYALGNDPQQKDNKNRLVKFYKSLYFQQLPKWETIISQSDQVTYPYSLNFQTVFYPPPVPPPEKA
jgi:hypothetical protein